MKEKHLITVIAAFTFLAIYTPVASQTSGVPGIKGAFRGTVSINEPTTTMASRYGFEFHIQHRFGVIKTDNSIVKQFLGTDLTANIRFGFAVPVNDYLMIACGRTKSGKQYDGSFKLLGMEQDTGTGIPLSVALYGQVAVKSGEIKPVTSNTFYADSITPFKNKFNHRLSYNTKLIISRKLGNWLSVQVAPTAIYRNLVPSGEENFVFALPVSGAIRTSKTGSLLFEASWIWNYKPENDLYPVYIGYEFGTAGHVFQVIAGTNTALLEQDLFTSDPSDYDQGEFLIGFNIKRTFWHRKKIQRMAEKNLGL